MLKRLFPDGLGISRKVAVVNIVLVANAFVWYFYAFNFLMDTVNKAGFSSLEVLTIWGINLVGLIAASILGSSLIARFKRRMTFLFCWMLIGAILSLTPIAVGNGALTSFMIVSAVLGVYFGIGMPICMGYYAAATETRNRSRLSGVTYLVIGLSFFILRIFGIQDVATNSLILAAWRVLGLAILLLLKPEEKQTTMKKVSYGSVIKNRSFLLYFLPWVMFSLVNWLVTPINANYFSKEFIETSTIIESIIVGTFAVVGGFFADSIGRKRLALAGFALLGLGYAGLGLFPGNLVGWWLYTLVDGVAWGVFNPIFLIIIWGDLAEERNSEKYYLLGSLPFLLSIFMRLSIGAYVASVMAEAESTLFSFASFFLFLAVLPLIYAPETLPEKTMKDRELKNYIAKAQKEAAKAQKKEEEKSKEENEETETEFEVDQDFEKAKEIAQKYY